MSTEGRQPAPDFDDARYERPNKNWLCGHACDGCPCRLGPSPSGQCRAGPECTPALVPSPSGPSVPGLWKCTRSASEGGPCELGPNPDGTCCRVTPPCTPVRSLRARRGLVVKSTLAACLGLILLVLFGPWRASVINPGPLTLAHSSAAFLKARAEAAPADPQGCAHCHAAAHQSPTEWAATALSAGTGSGPLAPAKLLGTAPRDFGALDAACQSCHQPHSFHQPSVTRDTSCSVCHAEHQGRDQNLLAVNPTHCTACHGDSAQMSTAADRARVLPAELFGKILPSPQIAFAVPRPPEGLTARITSFADHPEFRLHAPGTRDSNPLAFNHALHLTGSEIPPLNGQPLDCRSCHVPDPSGVLMQPISFTQHCQSCHGLPIDPTTPALSVPHGSPEAARAWIRALPAAYTDDAVRRLGLSGQPIRDHVAQKLSALRDRHPSGDALERKVFFGDPAPPAGRDSCKLCHVVEAAPAGAAPRIAPVQVPYVWLPRARFDHSRHNQLDCASCHAAEPSTATADILMPRQATCVACHSPAGGVADSCTACHGYHNPQPSALAGRRASGIPAALQAALATAPGSAGFQPTSAP